MDEAKIPFVPRKDRGPDLAAGEGNEAVVHKAETPPKVVPVTLLEGSQDGARSPEGVRDQRSF